MRICAIGPSHLAALRTAEKNGLVDTDGFDIDYMGHRARIFRSLCFNDGRLRFPAARARPLEYDLKIAVEPALYDALFFHGVIMRPSRFFRQEGAEISVASYSSDMRKKFALNRVRGFPGVDILSKVRGAYDGPILVSGQPEHAVPVDEEITDTGNGETELRAEAIGAAMTEMGFHYIPQPIETVLNGKYTRREFSVGSVALAERRDHRDTDRLHMNEKYGALVFNRALRLLTELKAVENSGARAV